MAKFTVQSLQKKVIVRHTTSTLIYFKLGVLAQLNIYLIQVKSFLD